ncbi:MAG: hypothetical protein HYR63_19700 [Proteobacteria bacterium]|nr:hypothetical protein [Pseudomonadota bacterium]MBI3496077.1 hypothetical protein [Pseudomonadota bacterium]
MATRTLRITEPVQALGQLTKAIADLERDRQQVTGLVIPRSFNVRLGVKHDKIEIQGKSYRTRPQIDLANTEIVIEYGPKG